MATLSAPAQLFFKCNKLKDEDAFSKSDPYLKLFVKGTKHLVGKTEVIKNSLNPEFKTCITVDYFFEMKQEFVVEVWDRDEKDADDALGRTEFTMGALMTAKQSTLTLPLSVKGTVTISATMVGTKRGTLALTVRGKNLKKMDLFSKSDPFLIISRQLPTGQRSKVYTTEVIDNTLNPQWKSTPPLDIVDLCGGDLVSQNVCFECFDKDNTSSEPMGSFVLSVEELMSGGAKEYELLMDKKGKSKSFGFIAIDKCDFTPTASFPEFLQSGMQVNMAFSIDFTGSNGPQSDPRSLHFYDPVRPNNYIRAMLAVSDVVQEYDSDRQFPAYGFGAVAPFTQGTSHFFPLNGNPANAYLNGMQQVVDTYAALLPQLRFSGPTNFAPTINAVVQGARQSRGVYTILMIMTDGAITDMQDTIDCIVAADDAPVSIIIIGIGSADFSSMEQLDGDAKALRDRRGTTCRRDLVQFVPFNEYERRNPAELAAAVLREIPRQVEVWARVAGVTPGRF